MVAGLTAPDVKAGAGNRPPISRAQPHLQQQPQRNIAINNLLRTHVALRDLHTNEAQAALRECS